MNQSIQIVIAEDHPMFREGIRLMLEKQNEFMITGEAGNGIELLKSVEEKKPDVVITDIDMPLLNGIDATRTIKEKFPTTGVIALTMYGDDHLIAEMMDAGANGYLLKNSTKEELELAIKAAHEGNMYFCNSTSLRLSKMIAKNSSKQQKSIVTLSEREKEIVKLICEQYATKEIADITSLTYRTVEKYRDHIMEKTRSKNMAGIVIYAIREGIYKP